MLGHAGVANQAHLRSHSGHGSSFALSGTPTNPEFKVELVLERMRLPLHVSKAKCECGPIGTAWGASPCCVSQVRKTAHQSCGTRKDTGQDLRGGGSHCAMQCQAEGHGHRSVCSNQSSRIGAPTAPRSATCRRRHSPVRPDSERRGTPRRCSGGHRSVCTGREGNRSSRIGAPTAPRSAACSPVRPDSERRSTPQRCSGGRRSMLKSQS